MSAKHALLGLLLERPAYPYQLADRLKQRLGPAWKVNSGQLYQTVKGLERDGLIERVEGDDREHEDRHVFGITERGVLEFERFFCQAPEPVRLLRRPLLVKITFAGPHKLEKALAKVDAYEQECAERLAEVARLREELPADGPLLRADHLLLRLNLSADVFQLEGELRWARHAREMLSWLASREAVWPAERERPDPAAQRARRERSGARRELFGRMAGSDAGQAGSNAGGVGSGSAGEDAPASGRDAESR
jgi:DNA-binding PadR family transcriptional regulator